MASLSMVVEDQINFMLQSITENATNVAYDTRRHVHSKVPSMMPVEYCRLSIIVPVQSLGTDGNNQYWKHGA